MSENPLPRGGDLAVRFFAPDGVPRSSEIDLGIGSLASGIGVQPDGSAWILAWVWQPQHSFGDVKLQHVAPNGEVGPLTSVCDNSALCILGTTYPFTTEGKLAMLPDGSFVVLLTYDKGDVGFLDETVILGRRYAPDGGALGDLFQVNRFGTFEVSPMIAALPDGRFLALWTELSSDGSQQPPAVAGIQGRSFAANGTPTSGDFRLMDGVPNALAAGPAGNLVAVFNTADGRIVARQFTSP